MNLHEFLNDRERKLTEELAERKRHTMPFETELGEVHSAIKALNVPRNSPEAQKNELRRYLFGREKELRETLREIGGDDLAELQNELAELQKVKATVGLPQQETTERASPVGGAPYQNMTIKDLIVTALSERQQGATLGDLLDFFRDQWGRDIDRASVSPQLSRLYAAGQVTQFGDRREWFLIPPKDQHTAGKHLFLTRDGGMVWKLPNQVAEGDLPAKIPESSRFTPD